jgi:transcriptional regulator with XRE-family HTH domain
LYARAAIISKKQGIAIISRGGAVNAIKMVVTRQIMASEEAFIIFLPFVLVLQFYVYRRARLKRIFDYRRMVTPSSGSTLFGKRLRELRLRAGIAQDRLGVMIGIDESCSSARMSRYETGVHEPPFKVVKKIAEALHVPASYFYCEDDCLAEIIRIYFDLDKTRQQILIQEAQKLISYGPSTD